MGSVRPSDVVKSVGIEAATKMARATEKSDFNHRAIEVNNKNQNFQNTIFNNIFQVAPPLPIKTFGRKAPVESMPEVIPDHINNNPSMNFHLQQDDYNSMSNEAVMEGKF